MTKAKILIVEDEKITAKNIRMTLDNLGYSVSAIASSREEALKKAGEDKPDLVLMDIKLNGKMEGIEAADEIRHRFDIPVVYLTAYADEETLKRARVTEPFGYILKPFERRELHSILEISLYKHRTEKKLRQTQQWLSTTLKNINDAVVVADIGGIVTFMNPIAKILTGYKKEEAIGKKLSEIFNVISENTGRRIEDLVSKVVEEGSVLKLNNSLRLITKDKKSILIEASNAPLRDERGNITEIIVAFRDVSEHDRLLKALKTSKATFDNIIGRTAEGVIVVDDEGIIRFVNKRAEEYFGSKASELIGKKSDLPLATEETDEIEIFRPNGESGIGEIRVVKTDWDGNQSYLVSIRDITERKRVMESLRRVHQEQIEARDQFLSYVSHELRTPLTVIHQFVTILLDGLDGNISPMQRADLEIILRNTNQLNTMIRDLLDLTRVITGQIKTDPQPLSLADLTNTTLAGFQKRADSNGVTIISEVPPDLPFVYADSIKVRQILNNLIDNALKFTPENGKIITRGYVFDKNPDFVCVEVMDTGYGIDPLEKEKIFNYLYQSKATPRGRSKGLGLGLYICKEIVNHHGGQVWVESQPREGSSFFFTLPIFSLAKLLAPILIPENLKKGFLSIVTVKLTPPGRPLSPRTWEQVVRAARDVLKNSLIPDSEVLLPSNADLKQAENFFLVACADKKEADVLVRRIQEQLTSCEIFQITSINPSVSFTTMEVSGGEASRRLDRVAEDITCKVEELVKNNVLKKED